MDPGVVFQDEVMDRNIAEKVAVGGVGEVRAGPETEFGRSSAAVELEGPKVGVAEIGVELIEGVVGLLGQ